MPSEYPTKEEMQSRESFGQEKPREITPAERGREGKQTGRHVVSAIAQLLARRTGKRAEEIASRWPEDTVRRTKYPVITVENDDGTLSFKHPIVDGTRTTIIAPTSPGANRVNPKN